MRNARWTLLAMIVMALGGCVSPQTVQNRAVLHAGYDALNRQDYQGAMARSDEFLQANPDGGPGTAEALYLQGRVYEQRAQTTDAAGQSAVARAELADARETYQHALSLNPSPKVAALLHAGAANVAYFQEDYFIAMREWAAAYPGLTRPDARAWVLYRLGLCQQRLGRFVDADRSFIEVERQFPHTEPAIRAADHRGARTFYVQIGSYAEAKSADAVIASLRSQGFAAQKTVDRTGRQAIRVGPAFNYEQAKTLQSRLLGAYPGALVWP